MRVNIYAEELTRETTFVKKEVGGRRFYGIRLFLASPQQLHFNEKDDDRSAITFWVPWNSVTGNDHTATIDTFNLLWEQAWAARKDDESILHTDPEGKIHLGDGHTRMVGEGGY